jgi:hypothetical protein
MRTVRHRSLTMATELMLAGPGLRRALSRAESLVLIDAAAHDDEAGHGGRRDNASGWAWEAPEGTP